MADVRVSDQVAVTQALIADGFDPPPYVGEEWVDRSVTWLPEGHRHIVKITALGKTVSGWQARVSRRQVDEHGNTVPSGCGNGFIYVEHLFGRGFPDIYGYERVTA
ncbi:hypothetical protein GCM10010172_07490 [Paractinoplanes ferrugineus]|uniref:Uncharacterized protein n=1 Tax=Paractinoplanes ferrugineus TaxID=113564 RepID=A0A919JBM8_9ACTN|nr:hypothetical protein [Actinoplanes ferrugineus]GIE16852.1 hypothetical protein Afe05nite_86920 [Actinoplanes ferrugineus]